MPKITYPVTNFSAGELSPRLDFRIDINKYRSGAKTIENGIVMPHGGIRKRPGFKYIFEIKSSANPVRLVPFVFNVEQAYMLEFGPLYIRIYKDQGIIVGNELTITDISQDNPGVVTYTGTDPSNGQQVIINGVVGMTQVNNRRFTVANVNGGANTFELSGVDTTGYTAYDSDGTASVPLEVVTTYTAGELDGLTFAQSNDTLYIAHASHPLAKLTRSSHTSWTLSDADIVNGPFLSLNSDRDHILTISATGSATIIDATKANPVVITTSAAHGFSDGAIVSIASVGGMTQLNGNKYIVKNPTSTTFELYSDSGSGGLGGSGGGPGPVDGTAYGTYTSGGTATLAATQYGTLSPGTTVTLTSSDDLFTADHVGAVFRLWEPGQGTGIAQPVATKTVANNNSYTNDGKVYGVASLTGTTTWNEEWRYPNHEEGTVRIFDTAQTKYFDSVYLHDSSAIILITAYSSATSATGIVLSKNHVPKSVVDTGTSYWEEGAWSDERGYPGVITFHESRLFAAASSNNPQTVWSSRTGAFEDFQDGADDDDALIYAIASDKADPILWMSPGKVLLLGSASGEYAIAASNRDEALTPSNVRISRQASWGSSPVKPIRVGSAIIFGQRNGNPDNPSKKLRELYYSFESDAYESPDITIISEHNTGPGVSELAWQASPESLIWGARADGKMSCLTYEKEQQVAAWHRQIIGGTDAEVERVASLPGADGDELWAVIARTINGGTKRYLEVLTTGLTDESEKEDAIYLDSALTYDGDETSIVSGLWHLEGEDVELLIDGVHAGPFTVTDGAVDLDYDPEDPPDHVGPTSGELIHVGLAYTTVIETLDLEAGAAGGTAKSRASRISQVWPDLHRSLGGRFGPDTDHMDDIVYRVPEDLMGQSPALRTAIIECDFKGDWERERIVRFEHDEPFPFTLLGLAAEISTSG